MMPSMQILSLLLAGLALVVIIGVAWWLIQRNRETDSAPANPAAPPERRRRPRSQGELRPSDEPATYSTEATAAAVEQCYKLAFSANRIDYHIIGGHARVLDEVSKGMAATIQQRDYFPRRPMLLPRLLQAINDTESTRQELVNLLLEDPAVAGAVLQRANSAFYRVSNTRIERLDRAVIMLGAAGLRGLMATAIMQPVFRVPKGYFDAFGDVIWDFARRSSQAAEACARADRSLDPFVSQMLGLLGGLSCIVLFRLTMEKYREQPNLLPRPEVFITAMQRHRTELACIIARSWELSETSLQAAEQQVQKIPPSEMSPSGRAMYYGELCGTLALLHSRGSYVPEAALRLLADQGLTPESARDAWRAATAEASK
jgi:HD-like signal output (HDOD) protein